MSGSDRTKRYRLRQRSGRIVLQITIDEGAIADKLIDHNYLPAWDATDRGKLRQALELALDEWAQSVI
jgi:hypothetical protein